MRLLVVTQYFWPETFIINDLVKVLRDQGHRVVVATGKPNYPDGVIFDGYEARGTQHEMFDSSIDVFRVPMRPRGRSGGFELFRNYLSFAWSGMRRFPGLLRTFQPDAIVVYMPSPITAVAAAVPLKWIKKAHLAVWVQDLWPESLRATGHITHPAALRLAGLFVRALYGFADTLLVQSPAFAEPVSRYASARKIVYYPNSISATALAERPDVVLPAGLREALDSHFCVVFAGNIGTVQAIPTIVEAAALLADLQDVRIVLIGSGSMSAWVLEQQRSRALGNLLTFGRLPMTAMPSIYPHAGALLVALKDDDILARTVPSKLQAYLAAGRPIVASLAGEGARIVEESAAGLTCAPEDPAALAAAIRTMHGLTADTRAAMGAAGRARFAEEFEMDRQARRLVEILEARMRPDGAA